MAKKRAFSLDNIDEKAPDYHGTAQYLKGSPGSKSFNVYFSMADALRLSLAIQACTLALNGHDRRRGSPGHDLGMSLAFKTKSKSVSVIEVPLKKRAKKKKKSE
jgi:hypothetical protein